MKLFRTKTLELSRKLKRARKIYYNSKQNHLKQIFTQKEKILKNRKKLNKRLNQYNKVKVKVNKIFIFQVAKGVGKLKRKEFHKVLALTKTLISNFAQFCIRQKSQNQFSQK